MHGTRPEGIPRAENVHPEVGGTRGGEKGLACDVSKHAEVWELGVESLSTESSTLSSDFLTTQNPEYGPNVANDSRWGGAAPMWCPSNEEGSVDVATHHVDACLDQCTTSVTSHTQELLDVDTSGEKAAHDLCTFYDISPEGWNPREMLALGFGSKEGDRNRMLWASPN